MTEQDKPKAREWFAVPYDADELDDDTTVFGELLTEDPQQGPLSVQANSFWVVPKSEFTKLRARLDRAKAAIERLQKIRELYDLDLFWQTTLGIIISNTIKALADIEKDETQVHKKDSAYTQLLEQAERLVSALEKVSGRKMNPLGERNADIAEKALKSWTEFREGKEK